MNAKYLLGMCAIALAGSALAHEASPNQQQTGDARGLTRAEVIADLNLWHRAGLQNYENHDGFDAFDPRYLQALAEYRRLRSGPEFVAEVNRISRERNQESVAAAGQNAAR